MAEVVTPTIEELYFYPIKSFRGLRTGELRLQPQGPQWDRQWMLVDKAGRFVTQREKPEMTKFGVALDESSLELSWPGLENIDFGLEERQGDEFPVVVWNSTVPAFEVSDEVSEWISGALKEPVRLVRLSESARREVPDAPGRSMRFVDSRPILVISRSSLQQLELKASVTLSMSRFRPTIVIRDVAAHAEDQWNGFKVGQIDFKAAEPCISCEIASLHPVTGVAGEEPLKTLATYRLQEQGICFGYYYTHLNEGLLRIGAPVFPR